ncbi:hypothetical protein ACKWTF_008785 [Chironomus riparius]
MSQKLSPNNSSKKSKISPKELKCSESNITKHNKLDTHITPKGSFNELNLIINEAKGISDEYIALLKKDEIDVKKMLIAMLEMNRSMLEIVTKLTSAVEHKNDLITTTFSDQLKDNTTFIIKEMNYVKREMDMIKKNDEIECVKTIQACSRDLKKVWIRFASAKDATDMRNANSHAAIQGIFTHMNIKLDMTHYPLETFFFQNRRFSRDQMIPETALCCVFASSALATIVKNGIRNFNKFLIDKKQLNLIKYTTSADWSFNIRQILKPCIEMKRFEVVEGVLVTNDGIKVYHKEIVHEERKSKSTFVNSMNELDILRKILFDFNYTVPAKEAYNKEYFGNNFEERKAIRNNYFENLGDGGDEYEISDEDCMD